MALLLFQRGSPPALVGMVLLLLLLLSNDSFVRAWTSPPAFRRSATTPTTQVFADRAEGASTSWGTADNWDDLSRINKPSVTSEMLETDYVAIQAKIMENFGMKANVDYDYDEEPAVVETKDDQWIRETIENFVVDADEQDHAVVPALLSRQEATSIQQEERHSTEITRLIRCNESPESLLLATGRAIPPLTEAERNDVRQLLDPEPTIFLEQSVRAIFQRHARSKINGEVALVMEGGQIARWMQVCLQQQDDDDVDRNKRTENSVSVFDGRVRSALGQYGHSGAIYEEGLQRLYAEAARNNPDAVWRDLRAHGIVSPAEFQYALQVQDLTATSSSMTVPDALRAYSAISTMPLDECDLMEDEMDVEEVARTDRHGKSSHEKVELVPNTQTPLWIKDGEFVFIDEQSCIGCMQCALASPGSFQMLPHSGRARTFQQRGRTADIQAAVHSCPVDCMHYVSFDELKKFESIRDEPVAEHHRHFGHSQSRGYVAATPLHVSRRDSDANHKDSFYHFQRNQCFKSNQCPTKGCFDCPRYKEDPGGNPYFQAKLKDGYHIRSKFLTDTGIADEFRKKVDL